MHAEITTEGIKYAGSKLKLLPHILRLAEKVRPQTVFDGFSGTTRVSQAFAQVGCRVIANDRGVMSVRYHFSNMSEDIHGLFTAALDALGIPWTRSSKKISSINSTPYPGGMVGLLSTTECQTD